MTRLLLCAALAAAVSSCVDSNHADGGAEGGGGGSSGDAGVVPVDAGTTDAGPDDAGVDAGLEDGGVDAGIDAGIDAGVDAGIDAGQALDAGIPGESCAHPIVLTPVAVLGGFESRVRVQPSSDRLTTSCATDAGIETVLQFELTELQNVSITVDAPRSGALVNVSLREASCEQGEVDCSNSLLDGAPFRVLDVPFRPAGTYFIVVELELGSWVDLTVRTQRPHSPATNDTCATPLPITFDSRGVAVVQGHTYGATNSNPANVFENCGFTGLPDVVYSYTLTQAQDIEIRYTSPVYGPAVFGVATCDATAPADELFCLGLYNPVREITNQQPGTYFVWFDGRDVDFEFVMTLRPPSAPPANDVCSAPTQLFSDGGTTDFVVATARGAHASITLPCSPSIYVAHPEIDPRADVFYSFHTTMPQRFEAVARVDAGLFRPNIGLIPATACPADAGLLADAGSDLLGCMSGLAGTSGTTLTVSELLPGDYLLAVQGPTGGPFELDARLLPVVSQPPANDTCASPQSLTLDQNGHAEARGSTRMAGDDHLGGVCRPIPAPDAVYTFTTPSSSSDAGFNALIDVMSENAVEYSPTVFVNLLCDANNATQTACGWVVDDSKAQTWAVGLAPSTNYHVFVEGGIAGRVSGAFRVAVDVQPPPPNDTCETAIPVSVGATYSGSVIGARRDYDSTVVYPPPCSVFGGPDVVYSFSPPSTGRYAVRVVPRPGISVPVSVIEGRCDGTGECLVQASRDSNGVAVAEFEAAVGRTYMVIVDSGSNLAGGNLPSRSQIGGFVLSLESLP